VRRYHRWMLILFDIDGTLLLTQRAGVQAMQSAGRELFGEQFTFDGIEFSGRLDTWIWSELARRNGVTDADARHGGFRATYARHLETRLRSNPTARLLPGVENLVQALALRNDVTLGLLTGNYRETGRLKIRHAGLDPDLFPVAAWADDGPTRRDLPPVAMRRHRERAGRSIDAADLVIIGDTPHDVDCARAHGCRCIGVGTGGFSQATLTECGADIAFADLSETDSVLRWMTTRRPAPA
jgi:phosphoglycolate phosphatase